MNPGQFIVRVLLPIASMAAVLASLTWMASRAKAEPLGDYTKWGVHPSGSIVFHYRMNRQDVFFMHPVVNHGEVPECVGLVNNKHVPECAEFQIKMGELFLVSSDSRVPVVYVADILPSHVRINAGDYISLIETTYKGKR